MEELIQRCSWATTDLYKEYHDNEWGKPVHDENKLFEMLILEGMQAGLSWLTILNKRETFRIAFDNFDCKKVALYDDAKIEELMQNSSIVRNRLKIKSAITKDILEHLYWLSIIHRSNSRCLTSRTTSGGNRFSNFSALRQRDSNAAMWARC